MGNPAELKTAIKNWLSQPGHRLLDAITVVLVIFFGWIGWDLAKQPTLPHMVLLGVVGYVLVRIVYEIHFSKIKVPTLACGFFERRKIAALMQEHAAMRGAQPYTVIDLGSGRGELTRHIAFKIPEARVIGLELSRVACAQAKMFQRVFGPKNVEYHQVDFFAYDCSGADAVVMYLNPKITRQLGEKLHKELKPGALVIAHSFQLEGVWPAPETVTVYTPFKMTLFVYRR